MIDDFPDIYDLEDDLKPSGITPHEVMEKSYIDVYKRDWKRYLLNIEWDTWCVPYDAKTILQMAREREIATHPFKKFF